MVCPFARLSVEFVLLVVGNEGLGDGLSHSAVHVLAPAKMFGLAGTSRNSVPEKEGRKIRRSHREGDILDLRDVTTTGDTDTDVDVGELVQANDEQWLVDLSCENVSTSTPSPVQPLRGTRDVSLLFHV